jgi:hypothetical protein
VGLFLLKPGSETYVVKPTEGKVPIRRELINRGGTSKLGVDLCRVTNRKPAGESQQAFLFCAYRVQRPEERRWDFSRRQLR